MTTTLVDRLTIGDIDQDKARAFGLDLADVNDTISTAWPGSYINDFIDTIGDVFNALLAHMQGAPPLPVQQNRDAFLAYVKQNDLRGLDPFYSAYPQASVVTILDALNQG